MAALMYISSRLGEPLSVSKMFVSSAHNGHTVRIIPACNCANPAYNALYFTRQEHLAETHVHYALVKTYPRGVEGSTTIMFTEPKLVFEDGASEDEILEYLGETRWNG